MIFESWIHNRIKQTFDNDSEFRQFLGKENLEQVSRKDIEAYQIFRLKKTIKYSSSKSAFYRGLESRVGDIRSYDDLQKIPFTDPQDLAQSPYKLLCISMSRIARIFSHTTTGTTTGRLKKVFFTHKDADAIIDSMEAIMSTVLESAGINRKGCVVQIFLPDNGPPFSIAGLIARGAEKFGGIPVIGNCAANTEDQILSIEKEKPGLLMGSAFRIWRITQEASVSHNPAEMGVKAVFVTSEYLSMPMRKRLENVWQAEVFHHYGMTEPGFAIGVECRAHDGFHFNEADLLFEVVDPKTGDRIKDEKEGELVLTTLNREGMPLIRYRTGDVAALVRRPCECGAKTLVRIGNIPKRIALIAEIGAGEKIYTSLFDEVLYQVQDLVDYRIFLSKNNGKDVMLCKVEILGHGDNINERVSNKLFEIIAVRKSMEAGLLAQPEIEIVDRGVLRRGGRSLKRRIKDNRL